MEVEVIGLNNENGDGRADRSDLYDCRDLGCVAKGAQTNLLDDRCCVEKRYIDGPRSGP